MSLKKTNSSGAINWGHLGSLCAARSLPKSAGGPQTAGSHDLILIPILFFGVSWGNWDLNLTFLICLYETHVVC